jgi:hypothetical protein
VAVAAVAAVVAVVIEEADIKILPPKQYKRRRDN